VILLYIWSLIISITYFLRKKRDWIFY